jgi:hypothetical protein
MLISKCENTLVAKCSQIIKIENENMGLRQIFPPEMIYYDNFFGGVYH